MARKWLQLIPPERFDFVYGGSEGLGATRCTGAEWLARPGTVGLPMGCTVLILDEDRQPVPAGEVGEIFMRRDVEGEPFRYIGTETPSRSSMATGRSATWAGSTRTAGCTSPTAART